MGFRIVFVTTRISLYGGFVHTFYCYFGRAEEYCLVIPGTLLYRGLLNQGSAVVRGGYQIVFGHLSASLFLPKIIISFVGDTMNNERVIKISLFTRLSNYSCR